METGRDLACAALWQQSLERSLARRGRPTRSSLELFHLRGERDLSRPELLRESLMYSQLRRSAAARRPAMAVPAAGGVSALALLAAATLPGLVGGRSGGQAGGERAAFHGDADRTRLEKAPAAELALAPALAAKASAVTAPARASEPAVRAAAPTRRVAPHAVATHTAATHTAATHTEATHTEATHTAATHTAATHTAATHTAATHTEATHTEASHAAHASSSSAHSLRRSHPAPAPRHVAPTRGAAARDASGGAAHAVSGGSAPGAPTPSVPAARVPAEPQPSGHPSTGGGTLAGASHRTARPRASNPPEPSHATTHPAPKAAAPSHATTHPAPKAAAPAPPPPIAGRYANPLAGASVTPERVDQGVDYSGSGTLSAIGSGKVTYVGTSGTGWPGAFVEYQLTDGAYAGRYVFYAESIRPWAGLHVGQTVRAGQPIASISGGIEIGWGSGVGSQPLAQADGQWKSGSDSANHASPDGKDFSALVARLGGPPGKVEG